MTKVYFLPIRLASEQNQREHWATKLRRKKNQQAIVIRDMRGITPGSAKVRLIRIAPRMFDSDALPASFKHVRDAVASLLQPEKTVVYVNKKGKVVSNTGHCDEGIEWTYEQRKGTVREYSVIVEIEVTP